MLTTDPMNGAFETVTSRLPGSEVIFRCDAGFGSPNTIVTCNGQTLMWSPDPEAIVCSPIIQPPPSTREFFLLSALFAYNSMQVLQ